ncbi:MAG: hypothetical protein RIS99_284 [Bacteroidota bacterium]
MKWIFFLAMGLLANIGWAQTRVLFIGNSYTYVNGLPSLIQSLATIGGKSMVVDSALVGGYTFQNHSTDPTTMAKIRQGGWDFVVLQEQSQRPAFPPSQTAVEVFPYAQRLVDSIKKYSPCGKVVFFMTWGRRFGDQSNCASYPPICTYEGMSWRLRDTYLQLTQTHQAFCAPVGWAWRRSIRDDSTEVLHDSDNSHPNQTGSYLSACVLYSTIFQSRVLANPFMYTLGHATALRLQSMSDSVVFDSLSVWNITPNFPLKSQFTTQTTGQHVQFSNQSTGNISQQWDFGDGTTDTSRNPIHRYNSAGPFRARLTVSNGCKTDSSSQTFSVVLSSSMLENSSWSIAGSFISSQSSQPINIAWGTVDGRWSGSFRLLPNETKSLQFLPKDLIIWMKDERGTTTKFRLNP